MMFLHSLLAFWHSTLIHVVDIFVLAVVIYYALRIIQGTRAVQVARGVGVLVVVTIVIDQGLNLPSVGWLLRTFWMGWLLLLAVVFQPELRSLLAQLGSRPLGRLLLREELTFINELVQALKEGAENRVGMLVVLEQETGLRNFMETGTVIDGEVSADLLLTLFAPNTVLHDGAVIIRDGRLMSAGSVLPLSNDPTLARVLGTRHRAAIGITEISDALALVVSEETGLISLARGGRLERAVDADELRERLREFYRALRRKGLLRREGGRG